MLLTDLTERRRQSMRSARRARRRRYLAQLADDIVSLFVALVVLGSLVAVLSSLHMIAAEYTPWLP